MKGAVILKYNLLVALLRSLNWRYPGNKKPPSKWIAVLVGSSWLRGQDLNLRPSGYEPDELPGCSTPRQEKKNPDEIVRETCLQSQ